MRRMMNKFNKISISKKITLIYSIFFFLLLFSVSAFMIINAWLYYNSVSRSELEETAEKIVSYIEENGDITQTEIDELNPNKYINVVVNERGVKPPSSTQDHGFPPPEPTDVQPSDSQSDSQSDTQKTHFKSGEFNNRQYLYTMRMAEYNGRSFSVQVFRPQDSEMGVMRIFIIIFLVVNALAVVLSIAIGRFISGRMLKPIRVMTQTVDNITADNLSGRVEIPPADDEFRTLAITFNNMFDRLERSFEKQKQFVSDASHELRTPISVIQGYAGLIDRWGKSDEEVLNEAISSIKGETEHMSILINQLLFLAREDKGTNVIEKEVLDITAIVKEAASECEMTNPDGEVVCSVEGDENAHVYADSHLIKQTVRIILENAVKYTKQKPCTIKIAVTSGSGKTLISIADNGIGIAKDDLEHIFDRFYRSDKSRNKQIPGNGLGLSIACSIIKRHNGKIWADSEVGKGSTFYIELDEKPSV